MVLYLGVQAIKLLASRIARAHIAAAGDERVARFIFGMLNRERELFKLPLFHTCVDAGVSEKVNFPFIQIVNGFADRTT